MEKGSVRDTQCAAELSSLVISDENHHSCVLQTVTRYWGPLAMLVWLVRNRENASVRGTQTKKVTAEWCSVYSTTCPPDVCAVSALLFTVSLLCCGCDSRQWGHSCGAGGLLCPPTGACRHKENKPGKMPDKHGRTTGEFNKYARFLFSPFHSFIFC